MQDHAYFIEINFQNFEKTSAGPSVSSVVNVNQAVDNVDRVVKNVAAPIEIPVKPKLSKPTHQIENIQKTKDLFFDK